MNDITITDMKLRIYPDKVLFQDGETIKTFDDALRQKIKRMFKIMVEQRGIGLAAQQVGWAVRLFIVGIPKVCDDEAESFEEAEENINPEIEIDEYVFINPTFIDRSRKIVDFEEGCLSFPDIRANVKRPDWIEVEAFDEHGKKFTLKTDGLFARCIQHEHDHITGQLFNRLWSPSSKKKLSPKLNELQDEFQN